MVRVSSLAFALVSHKSHIALVHAKKKTSQSFWALNSRWEVFTFPCSSYLRVRPQYFCPLMHRIVWNEISLRVEGRIALRHFFVGSGAMFSYGFMAWGASNENATRSNNAIASGPAFERSQDFPSAHACGIAQEVILPFSAFDWIHIDFVFVFKTHLFHELACQESHFSLLSPTLTWLGAVPFPPEKRSCSKIHSL